MKFIVLFLISFSIFANTIPISEVVKAISMEPNAGSVSCEQKPEEECLSYSGIDWNYAELIDNEVIDYISKLNETSCSDIADCDAKFITASCDPFYEKIKNYDLLQVYCVKNIMKIDGKKLVENAEKKAAYEAAQASKKQLEIELAQVQKARDCGSRAINVMSLRNAKKGLSKEQRKQILTIYEDIKNMLDVGSLDNAKDAINSATADGILITEADKSSMIESIVGCQ